MPALEALQTPEFPFFSGPSATGSARGPRWERQGALRGPLRAQPRNYRRVAAWRVPHGKQRDDSPDVASATGAGTRGADPTRDISRTCIGWCPARRIYHLAPDIAAGRSARGADTRGGALPVRQDCPRGRHPRRRPLGAARLRCQVPLGEPHQQSWRRSAVRRGWPTSARSEHRFESQASGRNHVDGLVHPPPVPAPSSVPERAPRPCQWPLVLYERFDDLIGQCGSHIPGASQPRTA